MVQGWRRFHLLLVFLTLWKHAIGYPSRNSQVNPRSLRYHKAFSPRGSKSLSDAWVTQNIPVYVNSNVLSVKSPSSYQFGSASGTSESLSQTPSSQSGSVPASSASSQRAPGSPGYAKLLSSSGTFTSHGTSRQGSRSQFTSTSQDSSRSKLTPSSSPFVSAQGGSASLVGLFSQSPSTSSQYTPVSSAYPTLGSLPMAVSGPSSVKTSQYLFSSGSPGGSGQLATSHLSGLSSHPIVSSVQSQGSSSRLAFGSPQYLSASMGGAHTTSNQQKQASAQSLSQIPQKWQPSATSFSHGSLTSAAMSQSRFSVPIAPASSKSLASGGPLGQSAPASLFTSDCMSSTERGSSPYSQASGSAFSLSQSKAPQRLQPSASLSSQGFQTSSSAVSQSSSRSQSAKFPNRISLASGSGPSHPVSTQGANSYGGLTQSLGSSHYAPAYSKPASPLGDPSVFTSSQSHYASESQSMGGGTVGASRRYVSTQREVGSNIASLKPQAAADHYAAGPSLDVKVPVYSHATSSGASMSSSLQSQTWQPTSSGSLSSRFPSSGAALTQTSSSPQNVQSSSRFSSVAGGTRRLSIQSAGSYTEPSQSQGSVGPYTSGSPAYEKLGSSSLGVSSQSASGPSSSSQYSPISTTGAGGQLTSSSGYPSVQGESGSAPYAPAYSKPASRLGDPSLFTSRQSHYASKSKSMAGGTVGASRRYVSTQREVGSNIASLKPQAAADHYAAGPSLDVKVPVYSHATSSGASMSSSLQSQTWQPTSSGSLSSRFPSSGAALTQTSSSPQNVQSSSRFSSVAGGTRRLSIQSAGSYTEPSQSQGSVGPYTSGSPAYEKLGSSSLGVSSQSASGPSSSSQYSPISTTGAGGQLTSSGGYPSVQGESGSAPYAPAYSKPASRLGDPSLFTSRQSHYASKSKSMAGGTVGDSRRYVSTQREVGSNIASLKPQAAAGHYAPAPTDVKVPVYTHATSSGSSMSSSLQSQTWQPTTPGRLSSRFPSSGAALTQTSSSPQNVQSSSRFSSVAGGTRRLSIQSAGSYTEPSQSQGSVGPYTSGSPAYEKFGSSLLGVSSQSASGQSSSSQYSPISTTGASGQLASSSGYLSGQGKSDSYIGSSLLSQGALTKETLAPMDPSMSVSSQAAAVSSGIQASGATAFQSGSSQASSSPSSLHSLSSPVYFVPQSASGSSQVPPFGQPTGSMSQSLGSNVQASSEAVSSASSQAQTLKETAGFESSVASPGLTGGSTSVLSGSYESSFGQSAPVSKPSRGSLSGYYYGVKG